MNPAPYACNSAPIGAVPRSVGSMLLERGRLWPKRTVFAERGANGYESVSWRQFLGDMASVGLFLHERGIKAGDRVAVFCPNNYAMLVWEMAAASIGAASVPVFAGYGVPALDAILQSAEPRAILVAGEERLDKLEACAARHAIETVVTTQESPYFTFARCLTQRAVARFARLAARVEPHDTAFIQFTSGTTGVPKGVMLSHRNVLSQRAALSKVWNIPDNARFLSYLPWHHSFGGLFERFTALFHGSAIYLEDGAGKDIARLIENWRFVRPTQFFSVPRIFASLMTEAGLDPAVERELVHPDLKFVFTAAAPLPEDCATFFHDRGVPVMEGWGLTETSPCVTLTRPGDSRISGVVGEPIPGCELTVQDNGEIWVRGPNVTSGYWHDARRTESVLDALGWFHTGDLGELTPKGLKLLCRADGLFKLNNGEKVASLAVENCLTLTSHWIQNAVAVGAGESFVGALVFPNFRALRDWAQRCGRRLDTAEDFARDTEVQCLLREEIVRHADDLPQKYLAVKAAAVVPAELTLEAGQLTPSMKVVRNKVIEDYAPWVDALYRPDRHKSLRPYITRLKET